MSALHQASCWPAGHILRAGKSAGTPSAGQPFARASFGKTRRSETGQHQRWHRSNNAFKPRPLRGLVQVLLDFPLAQGRKSVRLNSALALTVDYLAAISRFASAAEAYCSWLEREPRPGANEHFSATRLVAELYAAALSLPGTDPVNGDTPVVTQEQREMILHRLKSFPFQYYWEVFHPVALEPEEPVCGDITDDLLDIYADVKEGLLAYAVDKQSAVWHWRTTFGFHWGAHATSALRALHSFDPEDGSEC